MNKPFRNYYDMFDLRWWQWDEEVLNSLKVLIYTNLGVTQAYLEGVLCEIRSK